MSDSHSEPALTSTSPGLPWLEHVLNERNRELTKLRARLRGIRHAAASVTPTARKEPEVHTLIAEIEKEIP